MADGDAAESTRAVIAMAQEPAIRVIAEGVRNEGAAAVPARSRMRRVPGFFYLSRPLPAGELALLARAWGRDQNMQRFAPACFGPERDQRVGRSRD